ncbi:RNA-directed DNA polymerase (reverse transcriptase)-related family protein, partial [Striga hermonthica]
NLDKSAIYFSKNTPQSIQTQICHTLLGITAQTHTKYLGLPLGIGNSKIGTFSFLEESVKNRISNWKTKFLSFAGKEVLLRSVLNALPLYAMSFFL